MDGRDLVLDGLLAHGMRPGLAVRAGAGREVAVLDEQRDGRAYGLAVAHAGLDHGVVGLDLHAAAAAVSGLAARQVLADGGLTDGDAGRQPFEDGDEPGAVRLARGEETQHDGRILPGAPRTPGTFPVDGALAQNPRSSTVRRVLYGRFDHPPVPLPGQEGG